MKYIFYLGRVPELSIAEISAILKKFKIDFTIDQVLFNTLILETEVEINPRELLVQMGGTIKISKLLGNYKDFKSALEKASLISENIVKSKQGKTVIGYSIYFNQNSEKDKVREDLRKYFSSLKAKLSKTSSIRFIYPEKEDELKSITVIKNRIIEKGIAFDFIFLESGITLLAKTEAVQNIESYSMRDYGRPKRDARKGMMPPKLAQVMINLANLKEGEIIFDPFCGVGTILQEALLNDYRAIGSDANADQIENCKTNLKWISEKYMLKYPDYKIFQSDSGSAFRKINKGSIDAIVTESTLGPVYNKIPPKNEIKQNFNILKKIYLRFFQNSKIILKKKAKIVLTLPTYKIKPDKYVFTPFIDNLEKIGYSTVCPLDKKFISDEIKPMERNSLIYSRPDQIVAREIFIFENK